MTRRCYIAVLLAVVLGTMLVWSALVPTHMEQKLQTAVGLTQVQACEALDSPAWFQDARTYQSTDGSLVVSGEVGWDVPEGKVILHFKGNRVTECYLDRPTIFSRLRAWLGW